MREIVLPDCPPPLFAIAHSMGATALIRAAYQGQRWFDRMVLVAPMIAVAGMRTNATAARDVADHADRGLGRDVCAGRNPGIVGLQPFIGNILTSDPVRFARNAAILEAEPALGLGGPTVAWADAAFRAMRTFNEPNYPARIRQPILIVAAGRDAVVSNIGDRGIRHAAARRVASHRGRRPARDC